jgi:poly(A) polymerase
MDISPEEIRSHIDKDIFRLISQIADEMQLECYVIGGFVRDIFLYRTSKDIDFVVVGSGIMLAEAVAKNSENELNSQFLKILERLKLNTKI